MPSSMLAWVDRVRDAPFATGAVVLLAVLAVLAVLAWRRRAQRHRDRGHATGGSTATVSARPSAAIRRRSVPPPLFAGRDEVPDPLTVGLSAAADVHEVLEVLDANDPTAALADAVEPPPAPPPPTVPPAPRVAQVRAAEPTPIAWMLLVGGAVLVIARRRRRRRMP
jgi:hypothetical protein